MKSSGQIDKLVDATSAILDETRPAYSCRDDVLKLKSIFEELSGKSIEPGLDISTGETKTGSGVAISPTMAAMCLDDFARTVQFIRGVNAAITDKLAEITSRPVHVLYAGCGPWAPLAIPLMTLFSGDEVRFTLIDIHDESICSVERIISSLELGDRIEKLETGDASVYVIDGVRKPDLIVVEMLRATLESEPQIAVVANLHSQASEATLIPEKLTIELALVDQSMEFSFADESPKRNRILIGPIFTADREVLDRGLEPTVITVPDFEPLRFQAMLLTTVQIYGDYILCDYDSGITCPKKLTTSESLRSGDKIEFTYRVGSSPRLIARMVK